MTKLQNPFLTVVITTYKRPAFLRECVQSILGQDFRDFELIIVNNDSETPVTTESLGLTDPRMEIINRSAHRFHIKNVNEALANARGEYFTWIPDDDYYASGFFAAMKNGLEANGFPAAAFSSFTSDPAALCEWPSTRIPAECLPGVTVLREFLSRKFTVVGVYGFVKTAFLREIGGIVETRYCDIVLVVQACMNDRLVVIRQPLVLFRKHEQSEAWSSHALSDYISSQKGWVEASLPLLRSKSLSPHFDEYLWRILVWCIQDFYSVIARASSLELSRWLPYFGYIFRNTRELGWSRFRVYKSALFGLKGVLKSRARRLSH